MVIIFPLRSAVWNKFDPAGQLSNFFSSVEDSVASEWLNRHIPVDNSSLFGCVHTFGDISEVRF